MENYIILAIILFVCSYIYLRIAKKFNIIDKPNKRSSHTKVTVRGGGIIFPIAILLFFFLNDFQYPFFVIGVFILSVISFLDDIYTLSSRLRFIVQFFSILLLFYQVAFPIFPIYIFLIFFFLSLGYLNVHNFMDGINGITGIYSLSSLSVLAFINYRENIYNQELLIFSVISILIFGFYNFRRKAIVFAGDIGSIVLGFLILFLIYMNVVKLESPLFLLSIIVYGADGGCTMLYRKLFTSEKWTEPHRHHIYQKLVDIKKWSHIKVSLIYASIQMTFNCVLFFCYKFSYSYQWILLIIIVVVLIVAYKMIFDKLKMINFGKN